MKILNWKDKLLTCIIFLVCLAGYRLLDIQCLIKPLLGIPCPGCGMTRAYIRVLHLDFAGAFRFHPMFWAMPILFTYYLFDGKLIKNKWVDNGILILIGVGFLVNWIIQLV